MGEDNKVITIKTDTSIKEVPNTKNHSSITETPTHTIQSIPNSDTIESSNTDH
jgi:hypothetical protein